MASHKSHDFFLKGNDSEFFSDFSIYVFFLIAKFHWIFSDYFSLSTSFQWEQAINKYWVTLSFRDTQKEGSKDEGIMLFTVCVCVF